MILGADAAHSFRYLGVLSYKHTVPLARIGALDDRPGFQTKLCLGFTCNGSVKPLVSVLIKEFGGLNTTNVVMIMMMMMICLDSLV